MGYLGPLSLWVAQSLVCEYWMGKVPAGGVYLEAKLKVGHVTAKMLCP